jgi:hypothetical protein
MVIVGLLAVVGMQEQNEDGYFRLTGGIVNSRPTPPGREVPVQAGRREDALEDGY